MHQHKREYDPKKEKREDKPVCKTITCLNCGKIIAEGNIRHGKIEIVCPNCKTRNKMEAAPRGEMEVVVPLNKLADVFMSRRTGVVPFQNYWPL